MFKKIVASMLSLFMILQSTLAFAKPLSSVEKEIQERIVSAYLDFFVQTYQSGQSPSELAGIFLDYRSDEDIMTMQYLGSGLDSLPPVKREGQSLVFSHKNQTITLKPLDLSKNQFSINGKVFVLDPTAPIELTIEVIQKNYVSSKSASFQNWLLPEAFALGTVRGKGAGGRVPFNRAKTQDEILKKAEDDQRAAFERKLTNSKLKQTRDKIDAIPFSFSMTLGLAGIVGAVTWAGYSQVTNLFCELRVKRDPEVVKEMDPEGICKSYLSSRAKKPENLCKGHKDTIQLISDQHPDGGWTQWTGYFQPDKPIEIKEVALGSDKKTVAHVKAQYFMKEDPKTGEKALTKIVINEKLTITKEDLKTQADKQLWADHQMMADLVKSAMLECAQEKYKPRIADTQQQINSRTFRNPGQNNSTSNAR